MPISSTPAVPLPLQTYRRFKGPRPLSPANLQLSLPLSRELQSRIREIVSGLPLLTGSPIVIRARPKLSVHRGRLLSRRPDQGIGVYAASFIRQREIILETELFSSPDLLRLILVHEIFHFAWCRLGNSARHQFAELLECEREHRAKGELGESSGVKKSPIANGRNLRSHQALWRDYVCESFCDTAAWLYAGVEANPVFTLSNRWRQRRKTWFENTFAGCCKC